MSKKVIDILPPKERVFKKPEEVSGLAKKEAEALVLPPKEQKSFLKIKKPEISFKKSKLKIPALSRQTGLIFAVPILILIFGFCYFVLSEADIQIWPETENINLETKLTIEKGVQLNLADKIIPGQIIEKEKTLSDTFVSSGKIFKKEKAEGTIKVYNAYSTLPQVLVAQTRFVSADGKVFRTPAKVTIPGGRYEGGKLVAGEIDIKVVADQPGPDYNIGPSVFSIPGFAGTEKYTKFFAKSFQSMAGGSLEEFPQVTEEDLRKAEDVLSKKAKEDCKADLEAELQSRASDVIFADKAIQTEIIDSFSLAKAGTESKDFNFQVKARLVTLVFQKKDFDDFVVTFIESNTPEGKKIHKESIKIDFFPDTTDLKSGKMTLSLKISAKLYTDINVADFKKGLTGKTAVQSETVLESQPGVVEAEVKFWPFWVRKVPQDLDKIKFRLRID